MLRNLFIQMADELEFQLEASKGGNVRGVTEDHRYEMAKALHTLRSLLPAATRNQRRPSCTAP